ncbi:MAG TPA: RHS repeat-associated core domain-containing protein [Phycisphaerales bacterium]|nr:RHS repeat-associated core domain-containing protein [Phycisphaerales bacterium]
MRPASPCQSTTDRIRFLRAGTRQFDRAYTLDDLDRLERAQQGNWSGSALSSQTMDEQWRTSGGALALDQLGNWVNYRRNLNGDADFTDTGELDETRTHSQANEILTRDTNSSNPVEYTFDYDKKGNVLDDGLYDFVFDAWNRLVKVKTQAGATLSEYRYNGLGQQIARHYDADGDHDVDSNDARYLYLNNDKWQQVAIIRSTGGGTIDAYPKRVSFFGAAGQDGFGGSSYIDEVFRSDTDFSTGWTTQSDSTKEVTVYLCRNRRSDVSVAIRDGSSATLPLVIEWTKYTAYGEPILIPFKEMDKNGTVNSSDRTAFDARITGIGAGYDVRTDSGCFDGTVDSKDLTNYDNETNAPANGLSILSSPGIVRNFFGYGGYRRDDVVLHYEVRHRHYNATQRRWLQRDPAEYVEGLNTYQYVRSRALSAIDPLGLLAQACGREDGDPSDPLTQQCLLKCREPGFGHTWCVDGRQHRCCICTNTIRRLYPGVDGRDGIVFCVTQHEHCHLRQRCPWPDTGSRRCWCRELECASLELRCLDGPLADCQNEACREAIRRRQRELETFLEEARRRCNGGNTSDRLGSLGTYRRAGFGPGCTQWPRCG